MIAEGRARNPLVLWRGTNTLVDGHHRLKILKAHPELKWSVVEQDFAGEDEAKEWIIKNALGTRNLTEMQYTVLSGRLLKTRKKRIGNQNTRNERGQFQKVQNAPDGDTAQIIANELGVNRTTVQRAEWLVDGLDAAEAVVPGFKDDVLTGAIKAQKQEIAAMRKQTQEEIKKSVDEIKERKSAKRKPTDKAFFGKLKEIYAEASGVTTTQYGLADMIREIDALGDSFIGSLAAIIKRRKNVIDTYDGQGEINECLDTIIERLTEMKGK